MNDDQLKSARAVLAKAEGDWQRAMEQLEACGDLEVVLPSGFLDEIEDVTPMRSPIPAPVFGIRA